jgi:hypothetical protein
MRHVFDRQTGMGSSEADWILKLVPANPACRVEIPVIGWTAIMLHPAAVTRLIRGLAARPQSGPVTSELRQLVYNLHEVGSAVVVDKAGRSVTVLGSPVFEAAENYFREFKRLRGTHQTVEAEGDRFMSPKPAVSTGSTIRG